MALKKFANRENEQTTTQDGRTIWLARSCAVVAEVCLYDASSATWHILLGQRGSGTPDFQGYWGLPCGYLDWDESLTQAMMREVWEECGVYLPDLKKSEQFLWSNNPSIMQSNVTPDTSPQEFPWSITDRLTTEKQNISMHYAILFAWKGAPFPELSDANSEPNEVADIAWVGLEEACEMELAFNHAKRIRQLRQERAELFLHVERCV